MPSCLGSSHEYNHRIMNIYLRWQHALVRIDDWPPFQDIRTRLCRILPPFGVRLFCTAVQWFYFFSAQYIAIRDLRMNSVCSIVFSFNVFVGKEFLQPPFVKKCAPWLSYWSYEGENWQIFMIRTEFSFTLLQPYSLSGTEINQFVRTCTYKWWTKSQI